LRSPRRAPGLTHRVRPVVGRGIAPVAPGAGAGPLDASRCRPSRSMQALEVTPQPPRVVATARRWRSLFAVLAVLLAVPIAARGGTPPPGFVETSIGTGLAYPTGIAVLPDGRVL